MSLAYIVAIVLALVPQLLFTVLYWKWIPSWTKNPYGRLAQLDSWSQILLLFILLILFVAGMSLSIDEKRVILAFCLLPFVFVGTLRLFLLKRAVDSSKEEDKETK